MFLLLLLDYHCVMFHLFTLLWTTLSEYINLILLKPLRIGFIQIQFNKYVKRFITVL